MPGLLLFVTQGAEQCVDEQPRCGGFSAHIAPQRSFLPDFVERYVGFRAYLYAPTRLTGRTHGHAS
jgi:hypothetical protein